MSVAVAVVLWLALGLGLVLLFPVKPCDATQAEAPSDHERFQSLAVLKDLELEFSLGRISEEDYSGLRRDVLTELKMLEQQHHRSSEGADDPDDSPRRSPLETEILRRRRKLDRGKK